VKLSGIIYKTARTSLSILKAGNNMLQRVPKEDKQGN
jgi:hypothetical protein